MENIDDPVARNRAANPRRTPDREPLGNHLMGRLYVAAGGALLIATVVLIAVLANDVLLPQAHYDGVANGTITVAFRRMRRPSVRAGGTLRTFVGVLAIDAVDPIDLEDITDADAQRAGYTTADEAISWLRPEGTLYRIEFHLQGPDPRIALRENTDISAEELDAIRRRLQRLDKASKRGPWTRATLEAIRDNPAVRTPQLAESFGLETLPFKRDVRKLKELGLTVSLPVGYQLSPRGSVVLDAL